EGGELGAEDDQARDGHDGHQRDDQAVLNHALCFFLTLYQCDRPLCHVGHSCMNKNEFAGSLTEPSVRDEPAPVQSSPSRWDPSVTTIACIRAGPFSVE